MHHPSASYLAFISAYLVSAAALPAGAALRIFEGLEMWDQLILCYRLLDKKQVAQELVLQRLQVRLLQDSLQDSLQNSSQDSLQESLQDSLQDRSNFKNCSFCTLDS
jgi:hypothetical protein